MATVTVFMKHNDAAWFRYEEDGLTIESEGYMPRVGGVFDRGYGDSTCITIDNESGRVIGWVPVEHHLNEEGRSVLTEH